MEGPDKEFFCRECIHGFTCKDYGTPCVNFRPTCFMCEYNSYNDEYDEWCSLRSIPCFGSNNYCMDGKIKREFGNEEFLKMMDEYWRR